MSQAFLRAEIASRVIDTPLLVHSGKAEAILTALGGRIAEGGLEVSNPLGAIDHAVEPGLGVVGDRMGRIFERHDVLPFDQIGDVAIIPIEGTLIHKGAWIGAYSGATSYQGIQTAINAARRTEAVRGVVFEVDSYGGQVSGVFDTAEAIAELSAEKPTIAILTDVAASAGYLLASQARQIVMPPDGVVGSIGAIVIHREFARALDNEGIKVTILRAGAQKMRINSFEHLPPDVAERISNQLEEIRLRFATAVASARSGRISRADALATEAEVFVGEEAVERPAGQQCRC